MEGKKISFGFMKTKKVEKPVIEEKKEFIECMEEKSIKVVGGEEVKEAAPLVIPMKPNTLVTAERLKQIADEVENALNEPDAPDKPKSPVQQIKTENESLDQMAVRELLEDAKKEVKVEESELTVPIPKKPVVEVQKESTLEDYEDVPIQEFGMAMLRGMGWTPSKEQSKYKPPQLRPKGLGLGADKVVTVKQKKKVSVNEKGEELTIVKNSFVKITAGKYSGYYGKVVSLDEDNGRVMVDIIMKKETVSLSEFMMQPVTKTEFDKESKVINADSFHEYKKSEKISQKPSKYESPKDEASSSRQSQDSSSKDHRADKNKSNNSSRPGDSNSSGVQRDRQRRDSSSSDEKSYRRKKSKKRYSSNDSLSSLSESDKKSKHKSSRRRYSSSSDSDSDSPKREKRKRTPVKKRDIDKKRKGKKKKRDRDRSPHHYKKHRK
ncbi:hypothetical protein ABMA28_005812 [Loxostege sticticalis]|uniref:KOW domain-containing protein n=1 Tax=Loxostege sticticalis TaxID=481309 RepID=A0ABD0SMZ0_LOXSC